MGKPSDQDQFSPFFTEKSGPSLTEYLRTIMKHKWIALLVFFTVLFSVTAYTLRQPRIYESIATLEIDSQKTNVLSGIQDVYEIGEYGYWDSKQYLETQYKIIQSRAIATLVVEKLHLDRDLVFLGLSQIEDEKLLTTLIERADPAGIIMGNLKVEPVSESRLVRLRYQSTDPEQGTLIVNQIAKTYIEQNLERKLVSTRQATEWLAEQVETLKKKLEESERALYDFKRDNDIIDTDMDEKISITGRRLVSVSDAYAVAETELIRAKSRYDSLMTVVNQVPDLADIASMPALSNDLVKELKLQYMRLQARMNELLEKYKENHPQIQTVKAEMERTLASLNRELKSILEGAKADYQAAQLTAEALKKELESAKAQARTLSLKQVEHNRLTRDQESSQKIYEQVLVRMKEVDLSALLKVNNIRILEEAQQPRSPVRPRVYFNLTIGFIVASLLTLISAMLTEMLDKTMKNADDIQRLLKVPLLGIIPKVKVDDELRRPDGSIGNAADLYSFLRPKSSVAECCRTVRTNIAFMSPERAVNKLLVTSASPREGKTMIAANLGITLSKAGRRVLIVDTDMRRPRIHKAFGMINDYGLSNIIMGTMTIEQAVRTTPIENLDVLTCGPIPPNPAELIGSERFLQILHELGERYDRVLLDSPPVIAVADAMILSNYVDGVVVVVRFGKTLRDVAIQAVKQLRDVNANVLGAVINELDLDNKEYGHYYYYYYHRYGYYYQEKEKEKEGIREIDPALAESVVQARGPDPDSPEDDRLPS